MTDGFVIHAGYRGVLQGAITKCDSQRQRPHLDKKILPHPQQTQPTTRLFVVSFGNQNEHALNNLNRPSMSGSIFFAFAIAHCDTAGVAGACPTLRRACFPGGLQHHLLRPSLAAVPNQCEFPIEGPGQGHSPCKPRTATPPQQGPFPGGPQPSGWRARSQPYPDPLSGHSRPRHPGVPRSRRCLNLRADSSCNAHGFRGRPQEHGGCLCNRRSGGGGGGGVV